MPDQVERQQLGFFAIKSPGGGFWELLWQDVLGVWDG